MSDINWLKQIMYAHYNLKVLDAKKVRDAWRVFTTDGPKCFKPTNLSPNNVYFIASAVEHLLNNGFNQTVPLIRTQEDSVCCELAERTYYLTDWISGREGIADSMTDACDAAFTLAKLHKASAGFAPSPTYKCREGWGNLPEEWHKHLIELEQYLLTCKKERLLDDFSQLYMVSAPQFIAQGKTALEILAKCNYARLVQDAQQQGSLCHRDFTYHNFIIDQTDTLNVIDFDYCNQDIRAYDIGRYARKIAKNFHWQTKPVNVMLDAYNRVSTLSQDELYYILAFVYFPQRYWRIANRYYSNPERNKADLLKQLHHESKAHASEAGFLQQLASEIA